MQSRKKQLGRRLWERIYPEPDPFDTHENWLQHQHYDLLEMTTEQLREEKERVNIRRLYDRHVPVWFTNRLKAIAREMNARKIKK